MRAPAMTTSPASWACGWPITCWRGKCLRLDATVPGASPEHGRQRLIVLGLDPSLIAWTEPLRRVRGHEQTAIGMQRVAGLSRSPSARSGEQLTTRRPDQRTPDQSHSPRFQ
jgi:hypothetical protein